MATVTIQKLLDVGVAKDPDFGAWIASQLDSRRAYLWRSVPYVIVSYISNNEPWSVMLHNGGEAPVVAEATPFRMKFVFRQTAFIQAHPPQLHGKIGMIAIVFSMRNRARINGEISALALNGTHWVMDIDIDQSYGYVLEFSLWRG